MASSTKKQVAPHMWVISKDSGGGYIVTIGDPHDPASKIRQRFSGRGAKEELRQWVKYELLGKVSEDHVVDKTGLRPLLVSEHYSDFYLSVTSPRTKTAEHAEPKPAPRVIRSIEELQSYGKGR